MQSSQSSEDNDYERLKKNNIAQLAEKRKSLLKAVSETKKTMMKPKNRLRISSSPVKISPRKTRSRAKSEWKDPRILGPLKDLLKEDD